MQQTSSLNPIYLQTLLKDMKVGYTGWQFGD